MPSPHDAPHLPGSVSVGVHTRPGAGAVAQVEELLCDARAVAAGGYDGVTVSEHHAGFPGYLPQPLLAASWVLAECSGIWAGPAPTLLGLRAPRLLAEEVAWLAARFPGRVALAVAPGYARDDFEAAGASFDDRLQRFPAQLAELLHALSADGPLAADPAVSAGLVDPASVLVAANSAGAARRAAEHGVGMLFPGGESPDRLAQLVGTYRAGGGTGPTVAIAVVWIGAPDDIQVAGESSYRAAAAPGMRQRAGFAQLPFTGDVRRVTEELGAFVATSGVDAINLRFRREGAPAEAVVEQIEQFAAEVLPSLRTALASASVSA